MFYCSYFMHDVYRDDGKQEIELSHRPSNILSEFIPAISCLSGI